MKLLELYLRNAVDVFPVMFCGFNNHNLVVIQLHVRYTGVILILGSNHMTMTVL